MGAKTKVLDTLEIKIKKEKQQKGASIIGSHREEQQSGKPEGRTAKGEKQYVKHRGKQSGQHMGNAYEPNHRSLTA